MRKRWKRAMLASWAQAGGIVYLFLDRFTTAAVAPLASPRTCEPGPGTWTIVDTGNRLSISGGRLIVATSATATASLVSGATVARAGGVAVGWTIKRLSGSRNNIIGLSTDVNNCIGFKSVGGGLTAIDGNNGGIDPVVFVQSFPDADRACVVICRPTAGAYYIVDGNLEWVGNKNSTATPAVRIQADQTTTNCELDDMRVATITGDFATDWNPATSRTASPASGATGTMTADGLVEITWTAGAGETLELNVRQTDADNRWIVRCDQAGATLRLIERNASVETQRLSAAQTWTVGTVYRVVAKCVGASITIWAQTGTGPTTTAGGIYSSATLNQTATGVSASGFATGSNLVAWPRTITLPNF